MSTESEHARRKCPICDKPVYYGIYCNSCHYNGRVDKLDKERAAARKGEKK